MTDNQAGENAESPTTQSAGPDNISEADLVGGILSGSQTKEPETKEELQPEVEEEESEPTDFEPESEEEAPEEEGPTKEGLGNGIDPDSLLDGLTPEEIEKLGKELGSKAVSRFGELTRKRREAEEALANERSRAKDELQSAAKSKGPNPFSDLGSLDEVKSKFEEVSEVVDWAENLIDQNDESAPDDVIGTANGRDYTKAEVKGILRNARKAKEDYLPSRFDELRAVENTRQLRTQFDAKAREVIPELAEEGSEINQVYNAMLADPEVKESFAALEKGQPKVSAQLGWLLAHASRSLVQWKNETGSKKVKGAPKPKAPDNPSPTAAPSGNHATRDAKRIRSAKERFESSGSIADLEAFLTARNS